MRYFTPDSADSGSIPSGMDNDPNADEEIIDQQRGDDRLQPAGAPRIAPDDLADSIAYALDGSGPGPTNDTPNVSDHKVITEGITGAGPDEEEDALRA